MNLEGGPEEIDRRDFLSLLILPPADVRVFMIGWVTAGIVILGLALACRRGPLPGCQAECPTPSAGCARTSVDPGACGDLYCSMPPPVCHYAPVDPTDGTVCPPALAGRCVQP